MQTTPRTQAHQSSVSATVKHWYGHGVMGQYCNQVGYARKGVCVGLLKQWGHGTGTTVEQRQSESLQMKQEKL